MELNDEQRAQYHRDGFLVSGQLEPEEVAVLVQAFERDCLTNHGPHLITEDDTGLVRALYAPHLRQPEYTSLVQDKRILAPARQLVTDDLYVYQCKINSKMPFTGDKWAWHQDYPAWRLADNLATPRLVNVAVFLDEVTEFNGPLVFVPGSHRGGFIDVVQQRKGRSAQHLDPADIALSTPVLKSLVDTAGMSAPKGPAGTIVFFSPEIVHGSANNISPYPRRLLIITYNDATNLPHWTSARRPEYLVGHPSGGL